MSLIEIDDDGEKHRMSSSFFRGSKLQLFPEDRTLERDYVVEKFFMKGWSPTAPFITKETPIVAFGSCFAQNVSDYLHARGYNVLTKQGNKAYVTSMGDGMVHTHAIRQQFEWAWEHKTHESDLWMDHDSKSLGDDEAARLDTKKLFDAAGVFIVTLGLSELWYDNETGEVFWRNPPSGNEGRHGFRVATYEETIDNLRAIVKLIRTYRPSATIIFSVSPIPLRATFRGVSCLSANAVSKGILRAAVDQLYREVAEGDGNLFYFPSYDVVTYAFSNQWIQDRRHVYPHVLEFNMMMFEHYFCQDGLTKEEMLNGYKKARALDDKIGRFGHDESLAKVNGTPEEIREARRQARIAERKQARIAERQKRRSS